MNEGTVLTNPLAHMLMFRRIDPHTGACLQTHPFICVDTYRDMHTHTQTDMSRPTAQEAGFSCSIKTLGWKSEHRVLFGAPGNYYVTLGRSFHLSEVKDS